jgi:hypothetical protein
MHTSCVWFLMMLYNVININICSLLCRVSLYHAWLKKTIAYLDADYVSLEADTVTDNGEISEVILPYSDYQCIRMPRKCPLIFTAVQNFLDIISQLFPCVSPVGKVRLIKFIQML